MNNNYGSESPLHISTKSLSEVVKMTSAFLSSPKYALPYPFLRSIVHESSGLCYPLTDSTILTI